MTAVRYLADRRRSYRREVTTSPVSGIIYKAHLMHKHFLKAIFGLFATSACSDFDLIDDIGEFTRADISVQVDDARGEGTVRDPFLLDIGVAMTIDLIDQRDPEANRSLSSLALWTSSDREVVAVDGGRIIGLGEGIATVTAEKPIEEGSETIGLGEWTIEVFEFERIEIRSETGVFATLLGRELQLKAVYYGDDNEPNFTPTIIWESNAANIARVSADGLVSSLSGGTASITAQLEDASVVAEVDIEVLTNDVDVFRVVIDNQLDRLTLGDSVQLSATAFTVSNVVIDEEFDWSSDNPGILEIGIGGWAIARNVGEAKVTATSSEGIGSDPLGITVTEEEVRTRNGSIVSARGGTTGTVTLFIDADDMLKLRLNEDFFGANIPGPVLFLTNSESSVSGGVRIQEIDAGAGGNRVFVIPGNPAINDFDYVIYHCEPFNIIYGSYLLE